MTARPTCDDIRDRALIERYVAGRLSDSEASELETHYLTCGRCQTDVRLGSAIRSTPMDRARRRVGPWAGLGLAVAAGLAGVLLFAPRRPPAGLTALGGVLEPPVYLGVPVRGAQAAGDSLFGAATSSYSERRYDDAAAGLKAAMAAGADSIPAEFLRAASLLMTNRNEEAAAGFSRVIARGETPYLSESRFYLAKALLRLGRTSQALEQLDHAGGAGTELGRQASALADSIRAIAR